MLERDAELARLVAVQRQVAEGADGACVVLSGDAGIGKSTLVQAFAGTLAVNTPFLLSGCEDLFTPRPFGPLVDLADRLPPAVSRALEQGLTYNGLFPMMLRYFKESRQPCVLAVEDLHWADAGTLDLVRFLGRRLFGMDTSRRWAR